MLAKAARLVLPLLATAVAVHTKPVDGNGRLGSPGKLLAQDVDDSSQAFVNQKQDRKLQLPVLNYVGDEGSPASAFPLGPCEGDCDDDSDCVGALICFQRPMGGVEAIPGCAGTPVGGRDYCYQDPNFGGSNAMIGMEEPVLFSRDENVLPIADDPLTLCEGDCDHNGQCEGSLWCFQRGGTEKVPGCSGDGMAGMDYVSTGYFAYPCEH